MLGLYIVLGVAFILILIIAFKGFRQVPQAHVMVIERLGKFHRVLDSGLHMVLPFFDKPLRVIDTTSVTFDKTKPGSRPQVAGADKPHGAKVVDGSGRSSVAGQYYWSDFIDLREQLLDFPAQQVITKDNLVLTVDAVLYYQITEPRRAVYEIENVPLAIERLTQTSLRTAIGALELDETFDSRDSLNARLRDILDEATDKWGVKVNRVELQDVSPPADFLEAMRAEVTAERKRRAMIKEAEGTKQAAITKAEGAKQAAITHAEGRRESEILTAEGKARARELEASAEADAVEKLKAKLGEQTPTYLLTRGYIQAVQQAAREGTNTVFLPFDTIKALGSLGALTEMNKGRTGA